MVAFIQSVLVGVMSSMELIESAIHVVRSDHPAVRSGRVDYVAVPT